MGIASGVGLISGIDSSSIIESLIEIESTPILLIQNKQAACSARISSYGSIKSVLSDLQTTVKALKETENYDPAYSVSSGNDEILTAEVSDSATAGSYSISVSQLATAARFTSNAYTGEDTSVGSGILHFKLGDGEKYSVEIDSSEDTLEEIAAKINESDADVTATILRVDEDDYRLTLTADSTGEDIDYTYQEEGFTFTTESQASDTGGESMVSESFGSDVAALGITGTLSINYDGSIPNNAITLDGSESLTDIQDLVNDIDGVTATIEQDSATGKYSLKISSDTAGESLSLTFDDADDTGGFSEMIDDDETVEAQQAILEINGLEVIRNENTIDDLIEGVTIDLLDADESETVTLTVSKSYSSVSSKISDFVSAYNDVLATIDDLQSYDEENEEASILLGDSTTSMLKSGLRRILFSSIEGIDDSIDTMNELGVSFDDSNQLEFDSDTFKSAMADYTGDVTDFFTSTEDGSEGFAVQMDTFLTGYLRNSDGILQTKIDGYNSSIDRMDANIESIERRLATREETLRQQYINLEELMATFSSTSSYLTTQLDALSSLAASIYS